MAQAQTATATARQYTHREILKVMAGLMLAMLTSMLSTSVVGTALPTIVGELGGQEQYPWVASATMLTMTVSTPLWGKLSDVFGRKLLFQTALALYVGASLLAGLSQDMGQLIAARAVQGLGVGGLSALAQVILGDIVSPRERGRYSGYMGAVFGVATVIGPLLGGFLVDADWLGWRWCFYVGVPLAIVAAVVIQRVLKLPVVKRDTTIDIWGATAITTSASALMLLLTLGGQQFAWNSPWTYFLGALTLLSLALAVLAERTSGNPILPPRLFRNRTFLLTASASLFVGVAMFGALIYMPQYLQIVKGMSPTKSGLMTLPMVVAMLMASISSGKIVTRTGKWKAYPVVGLALVSVGMFLLSQLHVDSTELLIGFDLGVLGLGLGLTMQMLILAAQNGSEVRDMASTTSGVSFFRALGGAMGVAAFGAILNSRLTTEMTELARAAHLTLPSGAVSLGSPEEIQQLPVAVKNIVLESFTRGLETVFLVGVPIAVLGFLAVLFLKELPLRGNTEAAPASPPASSSPSSSPSPSPSPSPSLSKQDLVLAGLLLELVAQRVDRATDRPSALLTAVAKMAPPDDRPERERARSVAQDVLRPTSRALIEQAVPPQRDLVTGGTPR
ncbi:MFS transporter [Nonomuraea glycinis]|uniref:MFS transporter n=1 Tax=Nonomuraea glycinis TaxID=2047744 RepID=A0A918E426_9ACTN|nr:MDR family MFS transporter [Nonomuraea glycinis]MCA2177067.1 MFS transporter [Nonomuraea glycinis]GGP02731.1 MFS transporter [Nonomuraea glycinis]